MKFFTLLGVIYITLCVSACGKKENPPVEISISPWPGYEFLYLAEQKGFFKDAGLNAKLIQLGSLSDAQRSYVNGYTDGLASTIIEVVQSQILGNSPLEIVMVPDYSNGGDVIITRNEFANISALKGKKIGCEVSSLGIFLLQRALTNAGLNLHDVTIINVEQMDGERLMQSKEIDAFISYPPVSIKLLKHKEFHTIFSSAEIPEEIIDTISISKKALALNPEFVPKLHKVWQMALDYYETNPEESLTIMAQREGISTADFETVLSDFITVSSAGQKEIFQSPEKLQQSALEVCNTLVDIEAISTDCKKLPNLVYKGAL
ncbi:MAG: NitT/TauT family transport system substrate-binding protein [Oleiphilaceae bacterium]|jgi:NitT/TauT family transport system substrate-binding protein